MSERTQLKFTDDAVAVLRALMAGTDAELKDHLAFMLDRLDRGVYTDQDLDRDLDRMFRLMDDQLSSFTGFVSSAIPRGYGDGRDDVIRALRKRTRRPGQIDLKTVNVLLQDSVNRYRNATERGKVSMRLFFKQFSKQVRLTEGDISEFLAAGLIDKQNARASLRLLNRAFVEAGPEVFDAAKLSKFKEGILSDFAKRVAANENLSPALRKALLAKKRKSLEGGRVLQLVNKNGDVMTFETRTYAEIVARTKIADAQVAGAIDAAAEFDVDTFQVTSHNTKTTICQPHEGKIYTTARSGLASRKFDFLSLANRPTYHVNCRHRLVAYPLTQSELRSAENVA